MSVKLIAITPDAEKTIAYVARVSSPFQDNPDYAKLVRYLIDHQHWSPLEHAYMTLEISTSRMISAQILRHRSFTFSEFCISGDSEITCVTNGRAKKRTIAHLFRLQNHPTYSKTWDRRVRVFDEATSRLVEAKVKEVFDTGVKPVFRVTLSDGKSIKATKDHKFLSRNGFIRLGGLSVGDFVGVNGAPLHQSFEWMESAKSASIANGTGVQGIADAAGISYHTARKWLRNHGLQFSRSEVAAYTAAWNKGLATELQPMYGKVHDDETRAKMRESSKRGTESDFYHSGENSRISFRDRVWQWQSKYKHRLICESSGGCATCGSNNHLEIDHIRPVSTHPELAFDYDNLQILCQKCHADKSIKETNASKLTARWKQVVSIEYVGEVQTYDMEIDHGSHNYVANGIITHNSQRYSEPVGYVLGEARMQSEKNRQSSIDAAPQHLKVWWESVQRELWEKSTQAYQDAIDFGVARECARAILPMNTATRLYMTGSVRSWIHYIKLRTQEDTQEEHRKIAFACKAIFVEQLPVVSEALDWK